jgi:hypothetical protein
MAVPEDWGCLSSKPFTKSRISGAAILLGQLCLCLDAGDQVEHCEGEFRKICLPCCRIHQQSIK